jgi:hypothetical protein
MVIIEGCDATGKSTLAKWLADELGFEYFKDGFHRLGVKYYTGFALKKSSHTVSDRFHLGEYVYPTVKQDGRVPLTIWQQLAVERILLAKPSVLVLCETDMPSIHGAFDTRGEDFITKPQALDVVKLFNERYDVSILPKIKFNYKTDSREKLLVFIRDVYKRYAASSVFTEKMRSIGHTLSPDVMLVGEGFNRLKVMKDSRAFAEVSASSGYLHQALAMNCFTNYYITNAWKSNIEKFNVDMLIEEFKFVKPTKVIALGEVAADCLERAGISYKRTDHPSYWKRFKHKLITDYAETLR